MLTLRSLNGFSETVDLEASVPETSDVTARIDPTSIAVSTMHTATLTLEAPANAAVGTTTVTVTGKVTVAGTELAHSVSVDIVVERGPNFAITATQSSQTVAVGATGVGADFDVR